MQLLLLKYIKAIFYQVFIILPNENASLKMFFIFSKKIFSFSLCSSSFFPFFLYFADLKGQMEEA